MHEMVMPPAMERRPLQDRSIFNVNDNLVSRKTSAIVQPVQKENRPLYMSPVLPGTGSVTHNVTRLLSNKENSDGTGTPEISTYQSGYTNISATAKELFRTPKGNDVSSTSEEDLIDVGNESHDLLRHCDAPNVTDSSMSTRGSASPPSTDGKPSPSSTASSSPGSGCGSVTSPEQDGPSVKKKARTNYRPDQVKALERQFHENPYPDAEMMETLSQNLEIPENKIKIWFQNKRARWRRRVNDNMNNPYNHLMAMSPVLPQMTPYGLMQASPFMTSSPSQGFPGFFNYQGPVSPNNNHMNQTNSRLPSTNQVVENSQPTSQGLHPTVSTSSHCLLTSPSQYISHNYRHLQYPPYLYQTFGTYSPKN